MAMTTIKIDTALRDRLNAEAQRRGTTAGSVVEQLFESWLREERFAAVREAMATGGAPDAAWADEDATLDTLAGDGLGTPDAGHAPGDSRSA